VADDRSARAHAIRTFLIADIRGYTAFTHARGDEAAAVLAARFAEVVREQVKGDGGDVVELRGDEALCVFDSPRASIRCAVAMQQRFADEIRSQPDLPLRVGIGIDAGEAVPVEDGFRGGALNLAARLCALAKPGEVLVSEGVVLFARRVEGVEYLDQGRVDLKGLRDPVRYYRTRFALDLPTAEAAGGWRRRRVAAVAAISAVLVLAAGLVALERRSGSAGAIPLGDNAVGQLDTGGRVVGQAAFADPPGGVAVGLGQVWVTNTAGDALREIDPASSQPAGSPIPVGSSPTGVAVAGGHVWVVDSGDRRVAEYDPRSGKILQSVPVGNGAGPIATGLGVVWVVNSADGSVQRIDTASGRVSLPISVGAAPSAIAVGGGAVWVTDEADGLLARIDEQTLQVTRVPVGQTPAAVAFGGNAVWVANTTDNAVTRVRLPSLQIDKIPVTAPSGIAFGAGGVWVASRQAASLTRIDPASARVTATIHTGGPPGSLVTAADRVWTTTLSAPSSHRGGTLRLGLGVGFDSVDPAVSFFVPAWQVIANTNDGLVGYRRVGGGAGAVIVPDLAVAVPSPTDDGRTYTFQVRRGISYSTGGTVKPSDFRYALERSLTVPNGPAGFFLTSIVGAKQCLTRPARCSLAKGVVADDNAGTLTFHLVRPDWSLLDELSLPFADAVPPGTPAPASGSAVPATGPYQITTYAPNHGLTLTRNPRFKEWSSQAQPAGFPDRITWQLNRSDAEQLSMIAKGALDAALGDPNQVGQDPLVTRLASRFPDQAHTYTRVQVTAFLLNARTPPFDNALVRQAVNLAVDRRKALLAVGGPSGGEITCQVLPPNIPGYRPYCPYTTDASDSGGTWSGQDLARARQLVAQSGTAGEAVTVRSSTKDKSFAGVLVSALRSLGYHVRLIAHGDAGAYFSLVYSPTGVQAGPYAYVDDYPAPADFLKLQLACGSPANVSHFCDPKLDQQMTRAGELQSTDPAQAALLWEQIDREMTDQAPWVPLLNDRRTDFLARHVGNYQHHPQWGMLVDQLWLR
jgi:ABC-type transport system substrate-binding protein/class 3 adenylate cyclase